MARDIDPEVDPKRRRTVPDLNPEAIREAEASPISQSPHEIEEWRKEFPYPWNEEDVATRRDILRFLLAGSGALFLSTGALAILGNLPAGPDVRAVAIAKEGELQTHQWKVFDFPDEYAQGILINLPEKGLVAYSAVCTHLSCAVIYQHNGQLHCPCHEGFFDATTGNVIAGPPTRPLPQIQLAVQDGTIYAVRQVLR